jgi:trigger factor
MDKDFFDDLGYENVNSEEELRIKIKEEIEEQKKDSVENKYINDCIDKAIENIEVEINPEIIHEEIHRMISELENQLKYSGMTLELYMKYTGLTEQSLHEELEPNAIKRIKERFMLEKIAEVENIEPTEEEINNRISELAKNYGLSEKEVVAQIGGKDIAKFDTKMRKAIDIITK